MDIKKQVVKTYEEILKEKPETLHPGAFELTDAIAKEGGIRKNSKVLDVASGTGAPAIYLAKKYGCHVTGVDLSEKMIEAARTKAKGLNNVKFRKADSEHLPFEDNSFDVVMSECSVSVFPNKEKSISEMARVCKHGGKIVITDMTARDLPKEVKSLPYSSCISGALSTEGYKQSFEKAGLVKVKVVDYSQHMFVAIEEYASRLSCCPEIGCCGLAELGRNLVKEEKLGYALIAGKKS